MIKDILHQKIIKNHSNLRDWYQEKSKNIIFPFYSSFDLRDSSTKISPVDANLFPAGFNNVCKVDQEGATTLCHQYLNKHFPNCKNLILLAEEHTKNPFYWDNIYSLGKLLEESGGLSVSVCVPGKNITEDQKFTSAKGHSIQVFLLKNKIKKADLIISNNDFSVDYGMNLNIPIIPPTSLGWKTRRKHSFFEEYNRLVKEFSQILGIEPWILQIKTTRFANFLISDSSCLDRLKEEVSIFLEELVPIYAPQKQTPFIFLKNNAGTYGLGMTTISSAQDIDNWNYKIKKKMRATKGGGQVQELIIQEGIASNLKREGLVAEPVIYLIGSRLAGGFLRTHKEKGTRDNLNSPGAVYRTLCISDLEIEVEGKPLENVYGWIAYLGGLAQAYELKGQLLHQIQS